MEIVAISDTHLKYEQVKLGSGDILIHAGDCTNIGTEVEVIKFLNWFKKQDFRLKILVPGNHDFLFERSPGLARMLTEEKEVVLLIDETIEIEGLIIHGSPMTPRFYDWAFNRDRGYPINLHWKKIPDEVDILITHGPPYKILDTVLEGTNEGCEDLLARVMKINPKAHIFGHIHYSYGFQKVKDTGFYNVSQCGENYKISNPPQKIEEF